MVKTINLNFDGYWREIYQSEIPKKSGIYAVYICKYNKPEKDGEIGTLTLKN